MSWGLVQLSATMLSESCSGVHWKGAEDMQAPEWCRMKQEAYYAGKGINHHIMKYVFVSGR